MLGRRLDIFHPGHFYRGFRFKYKANVNCYCCRSPWQTLGVLFSFYFVLQNAEMGETMLRDTKCDTRAVQSILLDQVCGPAYIRLISVTNKLFKFNSVSAVRS